MRKYLIVGSLIIGFLFQAMLPSFTLQEPYINFVNLFIMLCVSALWATLCGLIEYVSKVDDNETPDCSKKLDALIKQAEETLKTLLDESQRTRNQIRNQYEK